MKKLRMAVVGLGFGKRFTEDDIIKEGAPGHDFFEVTAVCRRSKEQCDEVAKEWGVKAYYDIDELLKDPDIDVINLMTGPINRADQLRRMIKAGKDVMTTKPFEIDADAAQAVLEEAAEMGRVIHLNSPTPIPSEDLRQIMNWQKEYNLGRPIGAHWQTWCTYREEANGSWYDDPNECPVAPIFRLGIYGLNDLMWFFEKPEEVQVMQSRIFTGRPTPDSGLMTIKCADGSLISVYASFCTGDGRPYSDTLVINFENGTVYSNAGPIADIPEKGARLELMAGTPEDTKTAEAIFTHQQRSGSYMWEEFYKACMGEKIESPAHLTPAHVANSIRIINAMSIAQHSGGTEKIK